MLPCNVIAYEKGNKTVISIIKSTAAMAMINNEKLKQVAVQVEQQLKKVFDSIKEA